MPSDRKLSMSRGEVAKAMYARVDTVDYAIGMRTLKNFRILRTGGAENRSGFRFVDETRYPTKKSRLLPFKFSVATGQTYSVEMGDLYAEFIQNGARIVEASQAISAISKANPAVVTYVGADTYANGDDVVITGGDMPEIIGRRFRVAGLNAGANTFQLTHTDGTNLDSTAFTAYTAGAVVAKIYKITTPYLEAELAAITFDQSADVMSLAHKAHPPQALTRLGATNWTLLPETFSALNSFAQITGTRGAAGAESLRYRVSMVDLSGQFGSGESVADDSHSPYNEGIEDRRAITAISNANPCVVTIPAHGYTSGDEVCINNVSGMTGPGGVNLNTRRFLITVTGANTFQLVGIDTTTWLPYTAGGFGTRSYVRIDAASFGTSALPNVLTWTCNYIIAVRYRVYRELGGVYGFIGFVDVPATDTFSARSVTFRDIGYLPDTGDTPPFGQPLFAAAGDYPACVAYAQGRKWYARSDNAPTTAWGSRVNDYNNFQLHYPSTDADAITIPLGGKQVDEIKHLLDQSQFLIFTAGGEYVSKGDSSGILKPSAPYIKSASFNGSADIAPVVVDSNVVYVQRDGSVVRDAAFDYRVDGYQGKDLTTRSSHLFDGHTITAMAFQKAPIQTVFCVRDDGTMLAMTYLREEELIGWTRQETSGSFESVCSVPEGGEEAVYVIVKRTRSGPGATTRRYVERLDKRYLASLKDAFFVDSGLTYDGRNTTATTMTLTGGPPWAYTSTLTLTASAAFFAATDVGNSIFLTGVDGALIRCLITAFTSSTVVSVRPHKTVPASLQGIAVTTWSKAVYRIRGLWHLEGRQIAVLGDGGVVADPMRPSTLLTVSGGAVTLPGNDPRAVIQLGLPYFSDGETLDLDGLQGEAKAGKRKLVTELRIHLADSIGGFLGAGPPSNDAVDPAENLAEVEYTDAATPAESDPALLTEVLEETIRGEWNDHGRVFFRATLQPMTVLAVIPTGLF